MKRVLLKSVFDAFEYVMDHYYPFGLKELVEKADTYAVISLQDSYTGGGFGFTFNRTEFCRDVLTLYVDDVVQPTEGAVLFSEEHTAQIIAFIQKKPRGGYAAGPLLRGAIPLPGGGCVRGKNAWRGQPCLF